MKFTLRKLSKFALLIIAILAFVHFGCGCESMKGVAGKASGLVDPALSAAAMLNPQYAPAINAARAALYPPSTPQLEGYTFVEQWFFKEDQVNPKFIRRRRAWEIYETADGGTLSMPVSTNSPYVEIARDDLRYMLEAVTAGGESE